MLKTTQVIYRRTIGTESGINFEKVIDLRIESADEQ